MSLPVQPKEPMGPGCVLELQPGWQLVPLDSYQNVVGGVSMKQGQDGTVPNILLSMWVEVGVCPGGGQLPLPCLQWTQLALVVFSQGEPHLLFSGQGLL